MGIPGYLAAVSDQQLQHQLLPVVKKFEPWSEVVSFREVVQNGELVDGSV